MTQEITTEYGKIVISKEVFAMLVGLAATECYGVVGMVSRNFREGLNQLLGREMLSRGVEILGSGEDFRVKIHIIVGYGTKISEIANNVKSRVTYCLKETTGINIQDVQIIVEDVRIVD